jgi:alkylation response protein AidB-like acyl-CoA dehydrogenase
MDFSLTDEQRSWQLKARRFAREEIAPISVERDQIAHPRETFDWEIIRKGSKLGFRTLAVPREWGGEDADLVTQALVMAELARGDSAISKAFSQNWKWSRLLAAACTREQKERFLKPFVADDTYRLGMGGTEANAGSDNRMPPENDPKAGWRLRAERNGDEWILNGEKTYIANGSVARLFFVPARSDPNADVRRGTTLFMIERDTPGFRCGKVLNKMGWRFYQNTELVFENARVPHANVVGGPNEGWAALGSDPSQFGEVELAANALGVCEAALDMAMGRTRTDRRGGQPLSEHQAILLKLSEMHIFTEALRSFVMRTAWERDQVSRGNRALADPVNAAFVMSFSREAIRRAARLNMEIHAASGAPISGAVEKLYRDSLTTHVAGDIVQRISPMKRLFAASGEKSWSS